MRKYKTMNYVYEKGWKTYKKFVLVKLRGEILVFFNLVFHENVLMVVEVNFLCSWCKIESFGGGECSSNSFGTSHYLFPSSQVSSNFAQTS